MGGAPAPCHGAGEAYGGAQTSAAEQRTEQRREHSSTEQSRAEQRIDRSVSEPWYGQSKNPEGPADATLAALTMILGDAVLAVQLHDIQSMQGEMLHTLLPCFSDGVWIGGG